MADKATTSRIEIKQIRSGIGRPTKHRRTLRALGLKHQRSVIHDDTPAIQGMIRQVVHLVEVRAVEE